ncbi:MAG: histidine phosphatase family protein [Clostridiales bacterium]|jgi:uncharacterized phosphatase|nr:histidine phosphatase family protein [Clostridiales bacterium]
MSGIQQESALICFVRHGETDWNKQGRLQGHEDIPLNETGIEQARIAAKRLSCHKWSAVVTSPLCRASRFGEIIAQALGGLEVFVERDFIERDFGPVSGLTMEERRKKFPALDYEGQEDYKALQKRFFRALDACTEKFKGKDYIIVSHGAGIKSVLTAISEDGGAYGNVFLENGSLSMLSYKNGKYKIREGFHFYGD